MSLTNFVLVAKQMCVGEQKANEQWLQSDCVIYVTDRFIGWHGLTGSPVTMHTDTGQCDRRRAALHRSAADQTRLYWGWTNAPAHPRRAIDCRHAASTAGRISVGHWAWHDTRTTESSTPTTTHDRHTRHVVSSSVSSQRGPCRISLALMISSNQPHNLLITNSVSARPTSSSSSSHDIFRVPKQQRHHEDHYSQRKYEQCCNSSGISMSSNDAGRLTGTERRWHHLVSCSRP